MMHFSGKNIFIKLMLAVLVVSFGIWGIGDIFRDSGGSSYAAKVGRTSISMQSYRQALQRRQEEMRQMLGKQYKPEMMHLLGIEQQVLVGLVNNTLIQKEAESLGIQVSDDEIRETIRTLPVFQGSNGKFDKTLYLAGLRNNGMSEGRFVEDMRRDIASQLLTETIANNSEVAESVVEALYRARSEQRSAEVAVLTANTVKTMSTASESDLKTYYDAHAAQFTKPEFRTLSYVELKQDEVQNRISVSDDELQRAYQERLGDLRQPEKRGLEQMLFSSESDAKAAAEKLKAGTSFADVAKTAPILNKNKLVLGKVGRKDAPAQAADQIFKLPSGGITDPLQSAFGWHIFHVTSIEEEAIPALQGKVRDDLTNEIRSRTAQDTVFKLVNDLQDSLAGGATMEMAAEKVGAKVVHLAPITREGLNAQNKRAALPPYDSFLNVAFTTNENEHSQATQAADGSYYIVQVDKVTPAHARPLADVKEEVSMGWKGEQQRAALKTLAEETAKNAKAGKAFPSGAFKATLKRSSETSGATKLSREMVLELFRLKPNQTTQAYVAPNGDYMIARLVSIVPAGDAKQNAKELDAIRTELKNTVPRETMQYYLAHLREKHHVVINESALQVKDAEGAE